MEKLTRTRLENLRQYYNAIMQVADPVTHGFKVQQLIHAISQVLIAPLKDLEDAEKAEAEAQEKEKEADDQAV